mmetsp:Transcript_84396/g.225508  ORF Transcript_84396/g.225508 Transcript_84396/m.225508 type:complete len:230 (-) Transcript_84396:13-702(-)
MTGVRYLLGQVIILRSFTTAVCFAGFCWTKSVGLRHASCDSNSSNLKDTAIKKMAALPRIVAFDLDATLWEPEMYELWGGGAPFTKNPDGTLSDRRGTRCRLMGNTAAVLHELKTDPKWKDTQVAYVSCTDEPTWAAECMRLFEAAPGLTLDKAVDHKEIYKANKSTHFRRLAERTGVDPRDMLFFDNEQHNCRNVAPLGVTCIYVPRGMTEAEWQRGLREFAANRAKD